MGTAAMQGDLWSARAADWTELQEPLFRPIYDAVLCAAEVGPTTTVLDVGCGAGLFGYLAGIRGARVAGLDAAARLIAIASTRAPEVDWRVGEMQELPFGDAMFDLVTGFNSFQYAADPVDALREARRVARQGRTVAVVVWGRPEDCEAAAHLQALGSLLPPPPPGAPGPFALSADGALEALASKAGLTPKLVADVDTPWVYPDRETALRAMLSAGPAVRAVSHSGMEAVRHAVTSAIAPFRTGSGYRLRNKFRYMLATA